MVAITCLTEGLSLFPLGDRERLKVILGSLDRKDRDAFSVSLGAFARGDLADSDSPPSVTYLKFVSVWRGYAQSIVSQCGEIDIAESPASSDEFLRFVSYHTKEQNTPREEKLLKSCKNLINGIVIRLAVTLTGVTWKDVANYILHHGPSNRAEYSGAEWYLINFLREAKGVIPPRKNLYAEKIESSHPERLNEEVRMGLFLKIAKEPSGAIDKPEKDPLLDFGGTEMKAANYYCNRISVEIMRSKGLTGAPALTNADLLRYYKYRAAYSLKEGWLETIRFYKVVRQYLIQVGFRGELNEIDNIS